MISDSESAKPRRDEMIIRDKKAWQAVLDRGAEVLYETKRCRIFRMPDGSLWRCLSIYRRAWPLDTMVYMKFFV